MLAILIESEPKEVEVKLTETVLIGKVSSFCEYRAGLARNLPQLEIELTA